MSFRRKRKFGNVQRLTAMTRNKRMKLRDRQQAKFRRNLTVRKLSNMLGIEKKFLDCAWNGVAVPIATATAIGLELQPSTGCTDAINIAAQGDGESNRDGKSFVCKQIFFNGIVTFTPLINSATAPTEAPWFFFAMVLDKEPNGNAINSEDVYTNPGTTGRSMLPYPLRNLKYIKRYKILDTKMFRAPALALAYGGTAGQSTFVPGGEASVMLSWSGDIKVEMNATANGADIVDCNSNAISIIAFCSDNTNSPSFSGKSRCRFYG